jgi:hypothetical protein
MKRAREQLVVLLNEEGKETVVLLNEKSKETVSRTFE